LAHEESVREASQLERDSKMAAAIMEREEQARVERVKRLREQEERYRPRRIRHLKEEAE
jgi:hypothetical protein